MTANEFIYQNMIQFPSIFPTKWHVLEHILLVLGNGMEWINGKPSDVFEQFESITEKEAIEINKEFHKSPNYRLNEISKRSMYRDMIRIKEAKDKVNETHCELTIIDPNKTPMPRDNSKYLDLYPISEHSLILCIPEGVDDTWKEAIRLFYREVLKPSIDAGMYSMKDQYSCKEYELPDWVTAR